MNLFQKGLLAFAVVILIAVATVALLVGQRAESEFRYYNALYSNRSGTTIQGLVVYYTEHGSWNGVQDALITVSPPGRHGEQGNSPTGGGPAMFWDFRLADTSGRVVADSTAVPVGHLTAAERDRALPLTLAGEVIGYFVPDSDSARSVALDTTAQRYIDRLHRALLLGGLVAFVAALLLAGVLTRSIIAPVQALTVAAQAVAAGQLDVRAPVRGKDEIARLGQAFNEMANSLERAEAARRVQTADIAHELRNPLAVLQGTLEALADGIYAPTPENTQPALDQVRTLNRLVGDLRTLALADAGQLHLERQPLDVNGLLARAIDAYREPLAEKGIIVHEATGSDLPPVLADYDRLMQVVINILSNAVRYVPGGGSVRVISQSTGDGITVRIVDNGPGIPVDDLPKLFERFWRGEPSRSRATGGSGLGMAIARHVIEAHGGRIWAEPTPGGGLTIGFWLPAA